MNDISGTGGMHGGLLNLTRFWNKTLAFTETGACSGGCGRTPEVNQNEMVLYLYSVLAGTYFFFSLSFFFPLFLLAFLYLMNEKLRAKYLYGVRGLSLVHGHAMVCYFFFLASSFFSSPRKVKVFQESPSSD